MFKEKQLLGTPDINQNVLFLKVFGILFEMIKLGYLKRILSKTEY